MKIRIDPQELLEQGACMDGVMDFVDCFGSKPVTLEWTHAAQIDFLKSPLRKYFGWAVARKIIPAWCLRGSNLRGSDLSESNLRGSDLSGSDLRGSNLRGSDLSGSDLRWSNLSGSNLSGSNLRGSDLRWSNLSGSNLSGSNLRGSDLSESNLSGSRIDRGDGTVYQFPYSD